MGVRQKTCVGKDPALLKTTGIRTDNQPNRILAQASVLGCDWKECVSAVVERWLKPGKG